MEAPEFHDPQPNPGGLLDGVHVDQALAKLERRTRLKRARVDAPPHVVIIGAGLAGLCAAYELQRRGWTYTILEAETAHVGGRVRTVTFKDGSHGELGAMRIPHQHQLVWKYVKHEFDLPTRRFEAKNDNAFYMGRGRRVRIKDLKQQARAGESDCLRGAYRLTDWEAQRCPEELWDHAILSRIRALVDAEQRELRDSNTFRTKQLDELDRLSLRRVVELSGLSNEAIEYLFATLGLRTLQYSSATELLREELSGIWSNPAFSEIVGGMEVLPKAFTARLRTPPRMGCEVSDFEQDERTGRVAAIYRERLNPGGYGREEGDFLICTIPLPALARLEAHRRFSPEKQLAMRDLRYESAAKLLIPTTTRFWEKKDGIFGGASYTDLMPGSLYYPSDNLAQDEAKSKGPGILGVSDCWGQEARCLGNMLACEREELTLELFGQNLHAELLRPGVVRRNELKSWYWDGHPWACGAFAFYMPGQFVALHHHVTSPDGRIYLAGEHCSRMHSWMEGALASAHDVVGAIIARSREEVGAENYRREAVYA